MITHYYKIGESLRALVRAQEAGLGNLIESLNSFGKINKITTKQDNTGNYKEINIKLLL